MHHFRLACVTFLATLGCTGSQVKTCETTLYTDADGDGYGDESSVITACDLTEGMASEGGDCDDADRAVNPSATEICDDRDNDCDGVVDIGAVDAETYYTDADGDGYGTSDSPVEACAPADGLATAGGDCDDGDNDLHPGAEETDCTDGTDYNCDGSTGYSDADEDGWPACEDCDDATGATNPAAVEVCDGVDNDCDGAVDEDAGLTTWYADADGDGYGDAAISAIACSAPDGYVADATDCDDTDPSYHPGATEACDDPADYNCDGSTGYADEDGDGWAACEECDDANAAANPGATEVCDGFDDDCDGTADAADATDAGTWYADGDGDGSGEAATAVVACEAPAGYVADPGDDCDPTDPTVYPGAPELCDVQQNDCDSVGWTTDDEAGTVSAESATGAWSDLTSTFGAGRAGSPARVTLPDDGTVWVCDGTWYVALTAPATASITVEGRNGSSEAILDGANGGSVLAAESGSALNVIGLTLQHGSGTTPADTTDLDGGALYASGATVALTDAVLQDNSAYYGGAIYADGGAITLAGTTLASNSATTGGAFYAYGASVAATDTSFSDNTASGYGGGLYFTASGSQELALTDGSFSDGYAAYGGAIYASAGGSTILTVDGTGFDDNTATYGGAVDLVGSASADLRFTDADFTDNVATTYGGAVYASLSAVAELALEGGSVDGNAALSSYGGGIYLSTSGVANVTLTDTSLTGNQSTYYGGGLYHSSSSYGTLTLTDLDVSDNDTIYRGGGLYISVDQDVALSGVVLDGNEVSGTSSSRYGGGMYLESSGGAVTITDCDFTDNTFGTNSGAEYGAGAYVTTSGSAATSYDGVTFSGNSRAAYGGGLYHTSSSSGTLTMTDVDTTGNSALNEGGGLWVSVDAAASFDGVSLTSNELTSTSAIRYGAGLRFDISSGAGTFTDVTSSDNAFTTTTGTAYGGGASIVDSGSATIAVTSTELNGNTGAYSGGGLYYSSSSTGPLTMTDTDISSNEASTRGGGFTVSANYAVDLTRVTIDDNTLTLGSSSAYGAGAYLVVNYDDATLTDSAVDGNGFSSPTSSQYGGGIYANGTPVVLSGTTITTNGASHGGGVYLSSGSVSLDATSSIQANAASDQGGGVYLSRSDLDCVGDSTHATGFTLNTADSAGAGVYINDTTSVFTATACDMGTGTDDNLVGTDPSDVTIGSTGYGSYGDDETFTCSGHSCL